MNDLDTGAVAHAVDSLLNFETVKYFNAEEREARRYANAVARLCRRRGEVGEFARLAQHRPVADHQPDDGAAAWRWSRGAGRSGRFSPGDVVLVSTLLAQLFRPLDLLGMVYRTIRQGVIDMGAMFDLIDTRAEVKTCPARRRWRSTAGHVRFEDVRFRL